MKKIILLTVMLFMPLDSIAKNNLPVGTDYPVKQLYQGEIAKQIDLTDEFTKMFRTRFRAALNGEIAFAGQYASTVWGCGTGGCHTMAFIHKKRVEH